MNGAGAYASSKAALMAYTKAMARELAPQGSASTASRPA